MKLSDVSVARKTDLEAYYAEHKEKINAAGILVEDGAKREDYVDALKKYLTKDADIEKGGSADIEITPADEPTGAPRTQEEQAASDGAATGEAQHKAAEAPDNRTQGEQAASDAAETSEAEHRSAEVPDGRTQEEQAISDAAAPELKEAKDSLEKIDPEAAKDLPEPGAQPSDGTPDNGEKKKSVKTSADVSEVEKQAALTKLKNKQQLSAEEEVAAAAAKKDQADARKAKAEGGADAPEEAAPTPEKGLRDMDSTELLMELNARGFKNKDELQEAIRAADRREVDARAKEKDVAQKEVELVERETKLARRQADFKIETGNYQLERENLNKEFEEFNIKKRKLNEFLKSF